MTGPAPANAKKTLLLDSFPEMATPVLYRAAIGPINTDYYFSRFTRFDAAGKTGLSWNWAASAWTLNWMVFRKLWRSALMHAAFLLVLPLLLLAVGRLVLKWSDAVELMLVAGFVALNIVVSGLSANALFYRKRRQQIDALLATSDTLNEACATLLQQSSSRQRLIRIMVANAALLCLAASGYMLALTRTDAATALVPPTRPVDFAPAAAPGLSLVNVSALAGASAPVVSTSAPVVPVLLSSTPATSEPSVPVAVAASAPASVPAAAPAPVVAASAAASAPAIAAAATPPASAPVVSARATPAKPAKRPAAVRSAAKPSSPGDTASSAVASADPKPFYINVGLFAQAANADRAHTKMLAAGLPVAVREVTSRKGQLTRVRAGPFDSQAEMEAAVGRIRALDLEAVPLRR